MAGQVQVLDDNDRLTFLGTGWDPGAKIILGLVFTPKDSTNQGTNGSATSSIAGNGTFYVGFGKPEVSHGNAGTLVWDVHESAASGSVEIG